MQRSPGRKPVLSWNVRVIIPDILIDGAICQPDPLSHRVSIQKWPLKELAKPPAYQDSPGRERRHLLLLHSSRYNKTQTYGKQGLLLSFCLLFL